jgi:hypothetical protein
MKTWGIPAKRSENYSPRLFAMFSVGKQRDRRVT